MKKKTVIVFGGSGRVGPLVCQVLAANGCQVVIQYHKNKERATIAMGKIRADGGTAEICGCDVCDADSVRALLKRTEETFGGIHAVVNMIYNDSSFMPRMVEEMCWEDWEPHLEAVHTHFNICKEVIPYMRRQHYGRILYVSGGLAYRFYRGCAAFSMVKAGLNAFCKSLAVEVGEDGITVNVISPGKVVKQEEQSEGRFLEDDVSKCPLGRFAVPEDIAHAILYLISPGASYVTGQTIYLAGGEIMPMP